MTDRDTGETTPADAESHTNFSKFVRANGPNKADALDTVDEHGVEVPETVHSRLGALGDAQSAIALPQATPLAGADTVGPSATSASDDAGTEGGTTGGNATDRGL